ncbi:unnamed protein product [Ilex paraguariensis]|uniref:Uncharacterized protein n=1 Tax=Ilex paraguariensis TaxID=185542 RepID=A0ABC8UXA1_9AQUA
MVGPSDLLNVCLPLFQRIKIRPSKDHKSVSDHLLFARSSSTTLGSLPPPNPHRLQTVVVVMMFASGGVSGREKDNEVLETHTTHLCI